MNNASWFVRPSAVLVWVASCSALAQGELKKMDGWPHEPPRVTLLSSGKKPLSPLRYKLAPGVVQKVKVVSGGQWLMSVEGAEKPHTWPEVRYELDVASTEVRRDGTATLGVYCKKASYDQAPDAPAIDSATEQALSASAGMSATLELDSRGIVTSVEVRPSAGDEVAKNSTGMELRSFFAREALKVLLNQLLVPLPSEPVGIGAQWKAEQRSGRGLVTLTQTTVYTLESVGKGTVKLGLSFGGAHDPASAFPKQESDVAMSGKGTAALELERAMPASREEAVTVRAKLGGRTMPVQRHHGTVHLKLGPRVE